MPYMSAGFHVNISAARTCGNYMYGQPWQETMEFGKLLSKKSWYLERNFGIWMEFVPFLMHTKTDISCSKFGSLLPGNIHIF